jgi:hypothetical protein
VLAEIDMNLIDNSVASCLVDNERQLAPELGRLYPFICYFYLHTVHLFRLIEHEGSER